MGEFLKDKYFILIRMILMILFCIYGVSMTIDTELGTGVSVEILLLVLSFISFMAVKEQVGKEKQFIFLIGAAVSLILILRFGGMAFILLVYFFIYEIIRF